ncbi:MAG: Lrp/AsnC ligand binding domain-containing protein, partial [Candidatus Hermodarchaeota archaeon]
ISLCKLGQSVINKVTTELRLIPQIKKIMSLTGDYDILIEIEVETSEELFDIFANKIDLIEGITVSNTHIVMKSWEK